MILDMMSGFTYSQYVRIYIIDRIGVRMSSHDHHNRDAVRSTRASLDDDQREGLSYEEKGTWVFLVVAIATYAVYLAIVLPRLFAAGRVDEIDYAATMLWAIGGAIVAGIVLRILVSIAWPNERLSGDVRDKQIDRLGERVGGSFIIIGGVGGLLLALFEFDTFWIANAIYLGFVASGVLSAVTKLIAYRRGLPAW